MPARTRILTTQQEMLARLRAERPALTFRAKTREEWRQWRRAFHRAIVRSLGRLPERVPLRPEILDRTDCGDYLREKVVFDSERFMSVPAWVTVPKGLRRGERRPGILVAHGHGIGKDPAVGLGLDATMATDYQKQMAVQLARAGYLCIAPDWRCFGERKDTDEFVRRPSRDGCNVAYLGIGYFGFHLLGLQVWDARRALDYLQSRPEVDGARLGCIGCSFGGTMTTYTSALDTRIGAAVIVCYLSTLEDAFTRGNGNYCGVQYMPGLRQYGDIAEVAMLIAPRPLMIQIGERDQCFVLDDAVKTARRVERAYRAADAADNLEIDVFPGEHEIDDPKALDFFAQRLPIRA